MKKVLHSDLQKQQFYDVFESSSSSSKTIYFLGGYGGKFKYFRIFLMSMIKKGYRVVYLQPISEILDIHTPQNLKIAIEQASKYIAADKNKHFGEHYLIGVSLGSYLGLNICLHEKFDKFVVIAGGSPILTVLERAKLFKSERKILEENGTYRNRLIEQWSPFDKAFKSHSFKHMKIMMINSKKDEVIEIRNLKKFVANLRLTNATVVEASFSQLPHTLQALSVNWRSSQISRFLTR
jgi:hypothetical protein